MNAVQCPTMRAAMNGVRAHHDVAHCRRVVALHSPVRAAVKSSKLAVNRSTAAVEKGLVKISLLKPLVLLDW